MNPGMFFSEVLESHLFRRSDSLEGGFPVFSDMALSIFSYVR